MKKLVSSTTFTLLLLIGILAFEIQTAKALITVYIKPDGSIYPSSAPISTTDNITYILTSSANIAITIQRNNIILDGKGYTINGTGSEAGINLDNVANVTIKNIKIQNFYCGLLLKNESNYNTVTKNTIANSYYGIYVNTSSNYNNISENTVRNNYYGIYIQLSSNINLTSNTITTNRYNGLLLNNSLNNILTKNTITSNSGAGILMANSKYNNISVNTLKLNNNGIELMSSSSNNISQNVLVSNSGAGIFLTNSTDNSMDKNNITSNNHGIYMYSSSNYNIITENNMTSNTYYGMIIDGSSNSTIASNIITANYGGIRMASSSNTTMRINIIRYNKYNIEIWGLTLTHFMHDIDISNTVNEKPVYYLTNRQNEEVPSNVGYVGLVNCTNITVRNLNLTNNGQGLMLAYTTDSTIKENTFMDNYYGIHMRDSSNNHIYHNAFINNTIQVSTYNSINFWDDGYPSGGNYWGDYNETDMFRGIYQNETNSDGICDKPYNIDGNNYDRYPLTKTYGGPFDIGITNILLTKTIVANGYILDINVTIINYGIETITFNLTTYANSTIINSLLNITLESRNSANFTIQWNTSSFTKGNYTVSAFVTWVEGETDTKDNTLTNGNVFVLSPEHDIAITKIALTPAIGQGYTLPINVEAMNVGNYTETFNISIYANSTFITSQSITLESGALDTMVFMWNTSNFARGNYMLSVRAEPVLDEVDLNDNERVNWLIVARVGDFGGLVNNTVTFFACDGSINGYDLSLFIQCYKALVPPEVAYIADLGGGLPPTFYACDGKVDGYDLALFIQCYKGLGP